MVKKWIFKEERNKPEETREMTKERKIQVVRNNGIRRTEREKDKVKM
jgi:hypothetical protein